MALTDVNQLRLPRRSFLSCAAGALGLAVLPGCGSERIASSPPDKVWGERGLSPGRLQKPRAITINALDELFIVDMTGRIQVFTTDGEYLRGWTTPDSANGKPSGLALDNAGNVMVADTHYFRMLVYTPQGEQLPARTIGGVNGHQPGEFNFVTDCVQDTAGNFYISEYGEYDRVQKFSPSGEFIEQWGSHGNALEQFVRPQKMALAADGRLWIADACNHRVQVFDVSGSAAKLVDSWGEEGEEIGKLRYPYDLVLDGAGHVYLCEFGNHRVQKFTLAGESLGAWGTSGRRAGEMAQPWGCALDSRGRLHILDSYNHRVQRVVL
ncbi:MAG TPA: NHL repeat-containing protein [Pirellulaceae bacterium]|nr:NHL repeat-containing protein [Pirellulaceae bacterium]